MKDLCANVSDQSGRKDSEQYHIVAFEVAVYKSALPFPALRRVLRVPVKQVLQVWNLADCFSVFVLHGRLRFRHFAQ